MINAAIKELCNSILAKFQQQNIKNTFTVAISGIDASGKGVIAKKIKYLLEEKGLTIALLSIDNWQMPKSISLLKENAAKNFYYNSFRWNAFFDSLLIPLKNTGRVN